MTRIKVWQAQPCEFNVDYEVIATIKEQYTYVGASYTITIKANFVDIFDTVAALGNDGHSVAMCENTIGSAEVVMTYAPGHVWNSSASLLDALGNPTVAVDGTVIFELNTLLAHQMTSLQCLKLDNALTEAAVGSDSHPNLTQKQVDHSTEEVWTGNFVQFQIPAEGSTGVRNIESYRAALSQVFNTSEDENGVPVQPTVDGEGSATVADKFKGVLESITSGVDDALLNLEANAASQFFGNNYNNGAATGAASSVMRTYQISSELVASNMNYVMNVWDGDANSQPANPLRSGALPSGATHDDLTGGHVDRSLTTPDLDTPNLNCAPKSHLGSVINNTNLTQVMAAMASDGLFGCRTVQEEAHCSDSQHTTAGACVAPAVWNAGGPKLLAPAALTTFQQSDANGAALCDLGDRIIFPLDLKSLIFKQESVSPNPDRELDVNQSMIDPRPIDFAYQIVYDINLVIEQNVAAGDGYDGHKALESVVEKNADNCAAGEYQRPRAFLIQDAYTCAVWGYDWDGSLCNVSGVDDQVCVACEEHPYSVSGGTSAMSGNTSKCVDPFVSEVDCPADYAGVNASGVSLDLIHAFSASGGLSKDAEGWINGGFLMTAVSVADAKHGECVRDCLAGKYETGAPGGHDLGDCTEADAGNTAQGSGDTSQTPCVAGKYQPDAGQSTCLEADAGNKVSNSGATAQTPCVAGKYQPDANQSTCLDAQTGHKVPLAGASAQTPCEAGSYTDQISQTECLKCELGEYNATPGADGCHACPENTASFNGELLSSNAEKGGATCQLCPSGQYRGSTDPVCKAQNLN
jgi:hypothetical protein